MVQRLYRFKMSIHHPDFKFPIKLDLFFDKSAESGSVNKTDVQKFLSFDALPINSTAVAVDVLKNSSQFPVPISPHMYKQVPIDNVLGWTGKMSLEKIFPHKID